jgi:hypothetical protein
MDEREKKETYPENNPEGVAPLYRDLQHIPIQKRL